MKSRILVFLLVCCSLLTSFGVDSNRFTLNTLKANFIMMGLDSSFCRGPYNASRNQKAYFLADWYPTYGDMSPTVRFVAVPGTSEIVRYAYFINGVQQGAETDSHFFDLPISRLSRGTRFTVCGIDKDGFRTPEFRANFDVIPLSVFFIGSGLVSSFEHGKYKFGGLNAVGRLSPASYSGRSGYFPNLGGNDKMDIMFTPKIGGESDFMIQGGLANMEFCIGGKDEYEKKRQNRSSNRQYASGFGSVMGIDWGAEFEGKYSFHWNENQYISDEISGKGKMYMAVSSREIRPPALLGIAYFKGSVGLDCALSATYNAAAENATSIFDVLAFSFTGEPYVELTGGVGGGRLRAEMTGHGGVPFTYNGSWTRVALKGEFTANITAYLYYDEDTGEGVGIDKDFDLFRGELQIYPSRRQVAGSGYEQATINSVDFKPLNEKRRTSHIFSHPLMRKANDAQGRILMENAPLEPISEIVANPNNIFWAASVDDADRSTMNVSKVVLFRRNSDGSISTEDPWNDGTNGFEPHLVQLSTNELLAAWVKANREWNNNEKFTNALNTLDVAVAVRTPVGTWKKETLCADGMYDHLISLSSDRNGHAVAVWVRNANGELVATSDSHDSIMYSEYSDGVWSAGAVLVPDAGRVYSGTVVCSGAGKFTYVYSSDKVFGDDVFLNRELYAVEVSDGTVVDSTQLTDNSIEDDMPLLSYDRNGVLVLAWVQGKKLVACRWGDVASNVTIFTAEEQGNVNAPSFVTDVNGLMSGIAFLSAPTNKTSSSLEIIYSGYQEVGGWDAAVSLTENGETEQNARVVRDEAGDVYAVYLHSNDVTSTNEFTRYGTLKEFVYSAGCDFAINEKAGLSFGGALQLGSNTQISVTLENRGLMMPIMDSNAWVRVYKGDGLVGEVVVTNLPAPGRMMEVDVPWSIAMSSTNSNFIAVFDEEGIIDDINRNNNSISVPCFGVDLAVDSMKTYKDGDEYTITAVVCNKGLVYSPTNVPVEFRVGSVDGQLIGSDCIGSVGHGESQMYCASIVVKENSLNPTSSCATVYAIVNPTKTIEEDSYENNVGIGNVAFESDTDADGLSDAEETAIGSNPNNVDSDGDGIPDFDEVRTYGSSPTNFSYRITFDAGSNGLMRDGTASALVVADTGVAPRPATVTPKSGYRFVGWEETLTPATGEMTYHAKYEEIAYYVNAVTGCDTNSGETASSSWKTLQYAVNNTPDDRRVYVADGVYEPFTCTNRNIVIESVNGPRYTIIDGGGTNRCATLGTSEGHTNTVLRGFTLRNGNASGNAVTIARYYGGGALFGTVDNCYVYGNKASYGSGISNARLLNSIVSGNEVNRGVVYFDRMPFRNVVKGCIFARNKGDFASVIYIQDNNGKGVDIENCLFYENRVVGHWTVFDQLLDKSCNVRNSTVVNNQSGYGKAGIGYMSVDNSIVWNNRNHNGVVVNDSGTSSYLNSCMESLQAGNGNITNDPQFVDAEHHVYLLKANSPCIGMSSTGQHIGMCDVAEDEGFVVGTEVDGYGLLLEPGTVVEAGRNVAFTAAEIGREFLHFKTNGVFATTNHIIEINNIHSDILVTAVFAKREFFVDATNGNDGNDGISWATARNTITSAINDALDYDTIIVTNGVYSAIVPSIKKITIQSVSGATGTVIDGGNVKRCVDCLENGSGITNAVIVGFTLRNGFSVNYGGGAVGGVLRDCIIVDCEATTDGGGACYSHLENCVVARNKAGTYGGGTYYGYADHCTICGNEAGASSGGSYYGTFYNCIVSKNFVGGNEVNWMYGSFDSCCTYPNRGNNPIAGDPMLVDGWNGDARLRVGSPCIEDGVQVCGAYVGEPLEGVSVSVGICGAGTVSNETVLVTSGDNATIEAVETVRPFLYWVINGEQITNHIYTITNLISDIRITAVFDTFDWYVDAEYGDDANDGSDWNVAKQTLQAAVAAAVDNENIYVESGTYGPISSDNKRIRIESMNGAELTFIDGGGTNRCAMLGQSGISYATNTVISGFSIVNGFNASDGGAVCGGTLEDCILSDNTTYRNGGATYYSNLERCVLTRNTARFTGGGAYNGTLRNCLVFGNTSGNAGGGVSSVRAYNSTIARNKTEKLLSSSNCGSGGSYQGTCYNTIVWDNRDAYGNVSNYNGTAFYYSCTLPQKGTACVTNDPQFIDADAGDFHLMVGSPCIDAGLNNYVHEDFDLEWDDRIQGVKVDVGCFEGAEYAAPPGQVSGLCAVRGVLTWDEMPEAEGFMIYRSTRKAPASAKYIGFSDANTYIDETAVDGTTYYYWVMAFNTLGMGMRSEAAENTWPVLLSITTSELPDATEMEGYTAQLEAIGGTPPYSWSCPARGYTITTNSTSTFAEVGTAHGWHADDSYWTLELPFDFPFYGNKYRTAYVNSNGMISFGSGISETSYSADTFLENPIVAVLWRDLLTTGSSDVYVESDTENVTIRWKAVYYNGGSDVNASIALSHDGSIKLAYGSGNDNGGFVGVSAGDGENFIIINNTSYSRNHTQDIVIRNGGIANGLTLFENGQITGIPVGTGTNTFTVTLVDATGQTEEKELSIVVNENPNCKPVIDAVSPTTNVYVKVGDSTTFAVTAHDPEGETLEYIWYLDGEEIECFANSHTFTATLDDAGAHTLECVVSDGLWTDMVRHRWSFRVVRDWYVDASAEDDSGDGSSASAALYSISEAVWYAEDGDTIYAAPGTYEDYLQFYSDRTVSIVATGGASCTFFTGQIDGYSTQWYSGSTVIQSSMTGFTFRGCYLDGTTLHGCVLTCDETGCYPSEAYGCRLFDCSVIGNTSDYSPIEQCELTRCTVAGNTVGEYGAVGYSSYVYDCIVWDNVTVNGETSNYDTETWYDEWWDDDAEEYVSEEYAEVHIFNSCTWPMPSGIAGTGNITSDPRLVDVVNGDLRLRVGSPCLVGGVQAMGVYLGDPVAGFVLSVRIEGSGAVSPMTAVVPNGSNATFEVTNNTRPFLGFSTNGVFATKADAFTWQDVESDGIVTAVFSNFTFYVDAATGDDANDGLSWVRAKASIQAAINDAVRGETIYVKSGTYGPISVGYAMDLRIESVDGKENTVIDGNGERQCANLGGTDSLSTTLLGFTLTNGYSGYGGGVYGGTLIDCDVKDNYAMYQGGGLYFSTAVSCQILDNRVGDTNLWRNANGGGAYGGSLINCLVANNVIDSNNYCEGGGTCNSDLYNCTVVKNVAYGNGYGGGVHRGCLYNTIVYGNFAEYGKDIGNLSSWYIRNSLVGEDPGFIDAENGDYRLAENSPCIDAGSNSYVLGDTDLDGNERIIHYTVDIGCYEHELTTPERDTEADFTAQMAGTSYGIFIGVGRYTYTSGLAGPTIDATNVQTRCVSNGYWRKENTITLLDAAATKSVVRSRIATLADKAVPGDTVLYYQSSHGGSHVSDSNYTKDAYICLHDERYEDYEMAEDLMQFAAGVKVVIILDTCHSAGMFKAMGMSSTSSAKSFALRVRDLMAERSILRKSAKSGITAADIGWIAAADYNQYSWDSLKGGAFTVAMLDGWKSGDADYDGDNRLNFHELWRYAKGIATGYYGEDATDAQCLNENVLLSRFAGTPDSTSNGESTETTPAPVEHIWLDSYPAILAAFGGDYEAMANAPSPGVSGNGKTWPNGSPCYVWQDFVAGTSPTNDTVFTATIHMNGNTPVITWEPDTPELRATRVYRTYGKKTLMDANWTDITDKDMSEYNFFKVTVDLP